MQRRDSCSCVRRSVEFQLMCTFEVDGQKVSSLAPDKLHTDLQVGGQVDGWETGWWCLCRLWYALSIPVGRVASPPFRSKLAPCGRPAPQMVKSWMEDLARVRTMVAYGLLRCCPRQPSPVVPQPHTPPRHAPLDSASVAHV